MTEFILRGPTIPIANRHLQKYLFENAENQDPDKVVLVDVETDEHITSGQLQSKYKKLSYSLTHYLKEGDVMALVCENTWLSFVPYFAALYMGSTVSMVNPTYVFRELKRNFLSSKPKVVFCSEIALENVLKAKEELDFIELVVVISKKDVNDVICIDNFIQNNCKDADVKDFEPMIVRNTNQTALLLSSSGTTGNPKCARISYRNLRDRCFISSSKYLGINASCTILLILPIYHIFGLIYMTMGTAVSSKTVILKKFRPDIFLESLRKYQIQKVPIVPPIAVFLAKSTSVKKCDLPHLKEFCFSAMSLQQEVINVLRERLRIPIRQIYGSTECCLISEERETSEKKNTCGEVAANLEVKIIDIETKQALPPYKKGEICVRGSTVIDGYLHNEQANKNSFDEEGFYRTGDLGYYDEEGDLFVVDRLKDLIKYKGFQVAPTEIEAILLINASIKEVAIVGTPNERVGELPIAFIVRESGSNISEKEIISFLSEYSSSYSYFQNGIRFVDSLPKNTIGKILKKDLREMISKGQIST